MRRLCSLLLLLVSLPAVAQSESGDDRNAAAQNQALVREVVRGYYFVANVGSVIYTNTHGYGGEGGLLSPVIATGLAVGSDFIDKERLSFAWQASFQQGLFNGPREEELADLPPFVEGDIHTFAGVGSVEASFYPTRRLGLGLRVGGGFMVIPLLMDQEIYQETIVSVWGSPATLHENPLGMIVGTPTLEYYTKLSHFSVGVDVELSYVFEFDFGIAPSGYLKYTF
jgi:hypothetical protein